jgi:PhzF family phenazine biosynthesis protein
MKLKHFVVDAFTRERFRGNSAAICVVETPLDEHVMRAIARENNLAETAFIERRADGSWNIRWLTPEVEVDLCGHATLASARVVLGELEPRAPSVTFHSKSGPLVVTRDGDRFAMDFPARPTTVTAIDPRVSDALGGVRVLEQRAFREDVVVVVDSADVVARLVPDFAKVRALGSRVLSVTASATAGDEQHDVDFVSRFFAPNEGIDEDPVTGSAHCMLGPLWGEKLGKTSLTGRQLSARRGDVGVELKGERVVLRGHAVLVIQGTIDVG